MKRSNPAVPDFEREVSGIDDEHFFLIVEWVKDSSSVRRTSVIGDAIEAHDGKIVNTSNLRGGESLTVAAFKNSEDRTNAVEEIEGNTTLWSELDQSGVESIDDTHTADDISSVEAQFKSLQNERPNPYTGVGSSILALLGAVGLRELLS